MRTIEISVAIPTYKRVDYVIDALSSICIQQTDHIFEILVLDNDCDQSLQDRVEQFGCKSNIQVRYIRVPAIGLHNGRHAAAREAAGDLLVFVDDDTYASPTWLHSLAAAFHDPDVHLATGPIHARYEATPPDWLDAFWKKTERGGSWCGYLSLLDFGDQLHEIDPSFVWGANFAIRKNTVERLSGFHPDSLPWALRRYRGDGETGLAAKAEKQGLKAVYQPGALIYHRIPKERMTVEYFERRAFLQGISDSFTAIRNTGSSRYLTLAPHRIPNRITWLSQAKRLTSAFFRSARFPSFKKINAINERVENAYRAGYDFHQEQVAEDRDLRNWVLRADYWDAVIEERSICSCQIATGGASGD